MAVSARPAIEKSGSCRGNRSYKLAEVAAYVLEEARFPGLERAKGEEQGTGYGQRASKGPHPAGPRSLCKHLGFFSE